jgi:hypothetical protein
VQYFQEILDECILNLLSSEHVVDITNLIIADQFEREYVGYEIDDACWYFEESDAHLMGMPDSSPEMFNRHPNKSAERIKSDDVHDKGHIVPSINVSLDCDDFESCFSGISYQEASSNHSVAGCESLRDRFQTKLEAILLKSKPKKKAATLIRSRHCANVQNMHPNCDSINFAHSKPSIDASICEHHKKTWVPKNLCEVVVALMHTQKTYARFILEALRHQKLPSTNFERLVFLEPKVVLIECNVHFLPQLTSLGILGDCMCICTNTSIWVIQRSCR